MKWSIYNKKADFDMITSRYGLNYISARVMVNRGISEPAEIEEYLKPSVNALKDPFLMKDMDKAVELIVSAIRSCSKIRVIGDYDVDGIMSTYILTDGLTRLGALVDHRIPERLTDGYGINLRLIEEAKKDGIDTIITCDNGISAVEPARVCREYGITMVITDHHEPPEVLPDAAAIVDIKRTDDTYPSKNLCGAVVAAKTITAVSRSMGGSVSETDYLDYMAMATICDVIQLSGESRAIVKLGLPKLRSTSNPGLKMLMQLCSISSAELNEYHVGYVIGPCFNATGRLEVADIALRLLKETDPVAAADYAARCYSLNEERKAMTKKQEDAAFAQAEAFGIVNNKVCVVYLPDCHESLAGIIAGRVRERYGKPAFVITDCESGAKGSGRSIPAYHMYEELKKCDDLLSKYGGHPMAAGLSLPKENISAFSARLNENCTLTSEDYEEKLLLDGELPFGSFDITAVQQLDALGPYGTGHERPVFAERNLAVKQLMRVGKTAKKYLKFRFFSKSCGEIQAMCFSDCEATVAALEEKYGASAVAAAFDGRPNPLTIMAAYRPAINEFNGRTSVEMRLVDIKFQ